MKRFAILMAFAVIFFTHFAMADQSTTEGHTSPTSPVEKALKAGSIPNYHKSPPSYAAKFGDQIQKIHAQAPTLSTEAGLTALHAYLCAHKKYGLDPQRILTIIDYSMPSSEKRLWVIDIANSKVLFHTLVAQGKNSGGNVPTRFSNISQSKKTSLGLFKTAHTYYGHDGYSMRLIGLDKGFNDNALRRDIVFHGAAYVSQEFVNKMGRLGRSWGCPALSKAMYKPVINTIKNGSLVYAYYPEPLLYDKSIYLHCNLDEIFDKETPSLSATIKSMFHDDSNDASSDGTPKSDAGTTKQ